MPLLSSIKLLFFFIHPTTTAIYTLSLHDALPICTGARPRGAPCGRTRSRNARRRPSTSSSTTEPSSWSRARGRRSEEHTSELQSPDHLVCRLLLEKKK